MACNDAKTTINGRTYFTVQMPAMKAQLVKLKLMRMLSGAAVKLAAAWKADDFAGQAGGLADALSTLFQNANEQEILDLQMLVLSHVSVEGKKLKDEAAFNEAFSGEYIFDLDKAFFWALGVNFASLFGESGLEGITEKLQTFLKTVQPEEPRKA